MKNRFLDASILAGGIAVVYAMVQGAHVLLLLSASLAG